MEPLVARAAATGADLVLLPEKWNGLGSHEILARRRRAARRRRDRRGDERLGADARDHARRRLDRRAPRGPREALEHVRRLRPRGRDRGGLPEDPHVRRRGRRGRLPRVRGRGAGRRAGGLRRRGLAARADRLLRPPLPELYRILAVEGAELVTVPAAFTLYTGKDHWELLLRARAVENQCYVVAANQWGVVEGKASYGRSSIVDPWGVVLAQAPDEDCRHGRARPRAHGADPPQPAVARQPPARRVHVAGGV